MEVKCLNCNQIFNELDDEDRWEEIRHDGLCCPFCDTWLRFWKIKRGIYLFILSHKKRYSIKELLYIGDEDLQECDEYEWQENNGGFA